MPGPKLPKLDTSPYVSMTMRVRQSMQDRLDKIAEKTGYKRHQIIVTFLEWAIEEWEKENHPTAPLEKPKH